ncbi:MAG: hypothetical protein E7271_04805 [Lachnospiraceae bacterium]|jgi:ABC-type Na+ efflux pump permease subunit|nr:hypothetical protein [Lachnospiraceae bacterium]
MHDEELTLGQWVGTVILTMIPCVGLICLLVWAFSGNTQIDKKRYAQAFLIFEVIMIVLTIILYAILGAAMFAMFSSLGA